MGLPCKSANSLAGTQGSCLPALCSWPGATGSNWRPQSPMDDSPSLSSFRPSHPPPYWFPEWQPPFPAHSHLLVLSKLWWCNDTSKHTDLIFKCWRQPFHFFRIQWLTVVQGQKKNKLLVLALHLDLRCLEFLWGPLTFLYPQEKLNLGYLHTLLLFFYWLSKIYLQPKRKTAVVFTVIHGHLHVASTWTTQHTHTFIPRGSQIYCILFLLNSSISLKLVLHGVYSS